MKKNNLKDGTVVEYRDGRKRMVFEKTKYLRGLCGSSSLIRFNNDLIHDCDQDMDIVKVWHSFCGRILNMDGDLGKPDWTQEKTIKILVDDKEITLSSETVENLRKEFDIHG